MPNIKCSKRVSLALKSAILLILLTGAFLLGINISEEKKPVITSDLINQNLIDIQELASVEYYYTNMGAFENQKNFYGWDIPFTTKKFIVSYDGIIKAGINLNKMTVDISGDIITVTLPEAEFLSHEILDDSVKVFDQSSNIFNPIKIEDYIGFSTDQKNKIEDKAREKGLLQQAYERAENYVKQMISLTPEIKNYTLRIKELKS